jgi:hypothetical protein
LSLFTLYSLLFTLYSLLSTLYSPDLQADKVRRPTPTHRDGVSQYDPFHLLGILVKKIPPRIEIGAG